MSDEIQGSWSLSWQYERLTGVKPPGQSQVVVNKHTQGKNQPSEKIICTTQGLYLKFNTCVYAYLTQGFFF